MQIHPGKVREDHQQQKQQLMQKQAKIRRTSETVRRPPRQQDGRTITELCKDSVFQEIFANIGIESAILKKDKEVQQMICKFIQEHGGVDKVRGDHQQQKQQLLQKQVTICCASKTAIRPLRRQDGRAITDLSNDSVFQEIFADIGIKSAILKKDKEVQQVICKFIQERGGVDKVRQDHQQQKQQLLQKRATICCASETPNGRAATIPSWKSSFFRMLGYMKL